MELIIIAQFVLNAFLLGVILTKLNTKEVKQEPQFIDRSPKITPPKIKDSKDSYIPQYSDQSLPLEQFVPNFSKPVTVRFENEKMGYDVTETENSTIVEEVPIKN